jgi:16S rRNA (adenine1518-N6/adenine1519-N6)-dimethyltransferase
VNLTDPGELKALLLRHGLTPTKKWGQHFLVSTRVVDAILQEAEGFQSALEVGPGPGVLTLGLSTMLDTVIAMEVDPVAVSALSESAPLAHVMHEDALRVDLGPILLGLSEPRILVSNMPYNITGPLLTKFAQNRRHYSKAVLMMQREVGDRILAGKGNSDAGSLSIYLQSQFDIAKVCSAPPGAFFPPPKVDSVVLRFVPKETGLGEREEEFFTFVRKGFSMPRKTLYNNLRAFLSEERIARAGFAATVRPHQLGVEEWIHLFQTR